MEKFILTGKYHDKFYNLFLPTAKHFEPLSADDLNSLDMQLQRSSTSELEDLESELKIWLLILCLCSRTAHYFKN